MSDPVLIVVVVGFFGVLSTTVTAVVPLLLARQTNARADEVAARVLVTAEGVAAKLAESHVLFAEAAKVTNGKLDEIHAAVKGRT